MIIFDRVHTHVWGTSLKNTSPHQRIPSVRPVGGVEREDRLKLLTFSCATLYTRKNRVFLTLEDISPSFYKTPGFAEERDHMRGDEC